MLVLLGRELLDALGNGDMLVILGRDLLDVLGIWPTLVGKDIQLIYN